MKHMVSAGKTLLVDGPAFVSILSGKVEVFGAPFQVGERIVIRDGKRLPFEVIKEAVFDLKIGANVSPVEVDGSTIPFSWREASEKILSREMPTFVVVIGGIDSGKTSFCTFLANMALRNKLKVAVLDGDLGQSDIGPPGTVGYSFLNTYIKDLFDVEADRICFIGVTSPSEAVANVVETLVQLKNEISQLNMDFLLMNTDGWIEGEDAALYKLSLVKKLSPNIVVGLQQNNELTALFESFEAKERYLLEAPSSIYKRNREKRRILRELSYKKYMKEARVCSLPMNWIKIEGSSFGSGVYPSAKRVEIIKETLAFSPIYCEETVDCIWLVLKKTQNVDLEKLQILEERLKKKVKTVFVGEEEGLLVALKNDQGKFLGIGTIKEIDYKRRTMKINTPVRSKISIVQLGKIQLDSKCREIGFSDKLHCDK
jgi:polynucleotide 5'-hydroxyl-kinase GRC3/NOL9